MPAVQPASRPHVIGLVVTAASARATPVPAPWLANLRARPGVRIGTPQGPWIPVTAEVDDPRSLHRWLEAQPGVSAVDVVFVEVIPEGRPDADAGPRASHPVAASDSQFTPPGAAPRPGPDPLQRQAGVPPSTNAQRHRLRHEP